MKIHTPYHKLLFLLVGLLAAWMPAASANTELGKSLLARAGSPLDEGSLIFNARLRFEHADQAGLLSADALTLRTRLGYQTPTHGGFTALVEGEYNWVLNSGNFAPYPPPHNAGRTVIADGETLKVSSFGA